MTYYRQEIRLRFCLSLRMICSFSNSWLFPSRSIWRMLPWICVVFLFHMSNWKIATNNYFWCLDCQRSSLRSWPSQISSGQYPKVAPSQFITEHQSSSLHYARGLFIIINVTTYRVYIGKFVLFSTEMLPTVNVNKRSRWETERTFYYSILLLTYLISTKTKKKLTEGNWMVKLHFYLAILPFSSFLISHFKILSKDFTITYFIF